ncbi:hypothetical protein J4436_00395 [Candidatus Woesearchaeota archaeon]|nr:hypothetical protein [Candidatus Woesearchaeota archaeon]
MKSKNFVTIVCMILIIITPFSVAIDNPFLFSQRAQDLGEAVVVNVAGQEPLIIRQALIEQQPVPVFAYLRGDTFTSFYSIQEVTPETSKDIFTDINNIPPIKDIRIFPLEDTLDKIDGIPKYVKPKNDRYSLNNLGYVIITLKQLELETGENITPHYDIPKELDLKFQAKILYDLEKGSLFGISSQDLILQELPDDEQFDKITAAGLQGNSFFNERGYLRATSIEPGRVKFSVYNKDLNLITVFFPSKAVSERERLTTFTLSEGQTSDAMTLSYLSNPFTDTFRVKVNQAITPQDKAYLEVFSNGQTKKVVGVRNSPLYSGSNWIVEEIKDNGIDTSISAENLKKFHLDPSNIQNLGEISIAHYSVTLKNKFTGSIKVLDSEQLRKGDAAFDVITEVISDEEAVAKEDKYCKVIEITPEDTERRIQDPACAAISNYKQLVNEYPSSNLIEGTYMNIGKIYSQNLIDWAPCLPEYFNEGLCLAYKEDMIDLSRYYYDKVIKLGGTKRSEAEHELLRQTSSTSKEVYLEDEFVSVRLLEVKKLTNQDKGFTKISVENQQPITYYINDLLKDEQGNTITGYDEYAKQFSYLIKDLDSSSVTLQKFYTTQNMPNVRAELMQYIENNLYSSSLFGGTINPVKSIPQIITYYTDPMQRNYVSKNILVSEINTKKEVSVTVLPGVGEAYSISNFTLKVDIEPRPFDFTPSQLNKQIEALNSAIDLLSKITDKLDSIVKTWKKTCLVTFTVLTLKNSFFSGTSRNLARKDVADYYKQECLTKVSSGEFSTVDSCYFHYSDEINQATDRNQEAIEGVNERLEGKTPDELAIDDEQFRKYREAGGTITDYRDYLRYKEFENDDSDFSRYIIEKNKKIDVESKINAYNAAQIYVNENKQMLFGDKEIDPEIEAATIKAVLDSKENPVDIKNLVEIDNIQIIDPNSKTAFLYVTDAQHITRTLELEQITELQRLAYQSGGIKSLIAIEKAKYPGLDDANIAAKLYGKEGTQYALDKYGKKIYVEKKFISTDPIELSLKTNIAARLLAKPETNEELIAGATYQDFKMYTSSITTQGSGLKNIGFKGNKITAPYDSDGLPLCFPTKGGNYVQALEWYKDGRAKTFRVLNVGADGIMDCGRGDDSTIYTEYQLKLLDYSSKDSEFRKILDNAQRCKTQNQRVGSIDGKEIICSFDLAQAIELNKNPSCIDIMSPTDCRILYNACDPVMCPKSRCNFGGQYQIENVIGSGIIGSSMLCLPNFPEVAMPVCLTGILAGLNNIKSLLEQYKSCLEVNLKEGKNVGLCDYIRSVGICELLWNEATILLENRGGIINWVKEKISGKTGGGEYLSFQSSFDNIGNSFNFFTTQYSNTYLAGFQGKSTKEIGTAVCRMSVNGHFPSIGEVLDRLSEPEDPPQFTAWFESAPYVTEAGDAWGGIRGASFLTPGEYNIYTVFYHIYAGNGFPDAQSFVSGITTKQNSRDVQYAVYLTNDRGDELYVTTNPETDGRIWVTIPTGQASDQTIHTVAKAGLDKICVVIQGKKICGFGAVSSDMAYTLFKDAITGDEVEREINTAEECVPEHGELSPSLGSLTLPQEYGLLSTGITRTCAIDRPTPDLNRWRNVGSCGKSEDGIDFGYCWLDVNTIDIKNMEKKQELLQSLKQADKISDISKQFNLINSELSSKILSKLNQERDQILSSLENLFLSLTTRTATPYLTQTSSKSFCQTNGFTISGLSGDPYLYKCTTPNFAQGCDTRNNEIIKEFNLDAYSSNVAVKDITSKCEGVEKDSTLSELT